MSESDEQSDANLDQLARKAWANCNPEALEQWTQERNEQRRRDAGFAGYGRGSRRDNYRRGVSHLKHARDRLAELGPEFAEIVQALDVLLEAVPPFQER